ncbi:MAG: Ppx/GppA family phosphatase [Rhodospirillales bacterium]|mgnify:FL=1|jgi:exopolyphosphatase/guanosine-5'-triphosphate,3'-diphosphate pyrophosphatase|nr:Ppx/GppA family phosphatase [Rhodospirillales bacterium]MBT5076322.1 Ppx/GppA family phosphatase [Rhodospirillales bacterium]MBT5671894.1 Ppx/GppA family phosphatase [Rhodospirillales bacterium]MBT6186751.1 Ppx/GppA family phosphatase [Rhodospirillales bacterium]MBT6742139.1 Ppx/GppA family phosphatase [Rhodospirillales bacterium]
MKTDQLTHNTGAKGTIKDSAKGTIKDSAKGTTKGSAKGEHQNRETFGAIDLGTNNCRLLVAEPYQGAFKVVDAFSRIVRLGEGLERHGRLSDEAMERTLGALRICASKMSRRKVLKARNVATEACRRAANCDDFLKRIRSETGLTLEIITTQEEASLALAGCAPLLRPGFEYGLVFDIGGGSTEILWVETPQGGAGARLIDSLSLPIGVVNLSEIHGGDNISKIEFDTITGVIQAAIAGFGARNAISEAIARGAVQMLGSSGTVTTLAGIHMGLPAYDRMRVDGGYLEFDEINAVRDHLMALDPKGRAKEPCIGETRADLVVAGCAILEAICLSWPVGRLRVADRGLREGILCGLMGLDGDRPAGLTRGA